MEEILAPAVLRVLKTLRHHLRVFQMPQIDVFRVVTTKKQIQPPVAIVVKPNRRVRVDPRRQTHLVAHARELLPRVVMEEFGFAPLVQEEIFVTVVVVIAPNRSHRNTGTGLIEIRHT